MKILELAVEHFGCVRRAGIELGGGLNVLYGRNDLGKSTLARAIRAALLLPHTSSASDNYVTWDSDENPSVTLTLELPDRRIWRIEKRFGNSGAAAVLRESTDGATFGHLARGREVDERIRGALGWGIKAPGGRGAPRGLPETFLSKVLLGEQTDVAGVLSQTIEADYDDSGKTRLTAALAAFAEDPLFKRVLEAAQAKVGEAFTPTGRKRSGKTSPFREVTDEVKRVTEYLEAIRRRVQESENAERELEARRDALTRCEEALHAAVEQRDAIKSDLDRLEARRGVEADLVAAREILSKERRQLDDLTARETRREAIAAELEEAKTTRDDYRARCTELDAHVKEAEEALRLAKSAEAEQARQIRRGELENRSLELAAEIKELSTERDRVGRARKLSSELASAETELAELERNKRDAERVATEAIEALAKLEARIEQLEVAALLAKERAAHAAIEELEAVRASAAEARSRAEEQRQRAAELESQLDGDLPTRDEVEAMRRLFRELEVAEAGLGGGMNVVIERRKPLSITARADGSAREVSTADRVELDAERALELELGDLARISVTTGKPGARRREADLRRRWETEGKPLLERHSVGDLTELAGRLDADAARRAEITEAENAVARLEELATERESQLGRLDSLQSELAALGRDLDGKPREAAGELLDEVGAGALEARAKQAREQRTRAVEARDQARDRLAEADSERRVLEARIESTRDNIDQLGTAEPDSGWDAHEAELARRLADLEAQKTQTARELEGLDAAQDAEVSEAERAVTEAQAAATQGQSALEAADRRVDETRGELDKLDGELEMRRAAVAQLDLAARQKVVDEIAARLATLPAPERTVTTDDLEVAEAAVRQATTEREAGRDDVRKAEGALETVGGQVVRQQQRDAREALRLAERREREVEIEYDAWKLVVDKLREAENTEGQHLGEALSQPVTERFAELTAHRYGKLAVGPDLAARGLVVSGTPRDLSSFSVGTQEQLATLLRLTVAEHLQTALVLDDHLAQTDPERSAHFRDLLRRHAAQAQIIVLTCRPLDYLLDSDLPPTGETTVNRAAGLVRVINLNGAIERSGADVPSASERAG